MRERLSLQHVFQQVTTWTKEETEDNWRSRCHGEVDRSRLEIAGGRWFVPPSGSPTAVPAMQN